MTAKMLIETRDDVNKFTYARNNTSEQMISYDRISNKITFGEQIYDATPERMNIYFGSLKVKDVIVTDRNEMHMFGGLR